MPVPTFAWIGAPLGSTGSVLPTFPGSGVLAGNAVMIAVVNAASAGTGEPPTPAAPAGCTLVYNGWGGTGTAAAGTGPRKVTVFRRDTDATAGEAGSIMVSNPASSSFVYGWLFGINKTAGITLGFAGAAGSDTSAGTAYSAVMDTDPGITVDDYLVHFVASCVAAGGWTVQAFSVPGATIGTVTEHLDAPTTSGFDARASQASGACTAGTSSAAATLTATNSDATGTGVLAVLRVREFPPARRIQQPGYAAMNRSTRW